MKVSWLSNSPWAATGYGVQSKLFVERLNRLPDVDMSIIAFWGLMGGIINWNGIPVYPGGYHDYAQDIWGRHCDHFGADATISLVDAWILSPEHLSPNLKWAPWYPVDMETRDGGLAPMIREKVKLAHTRIAMAQYGVKATEQSGLSAEYVPHGFDGSVFQPGDRAKARDRMGCGDRFTVGVVAANKGTPARKSWPQLIEAFSDFHKEHSDSVLYLHTNMGQEMGGVNIPELLRELDVPDSAVIQAHPYYQQLGIPDPEQAAMYNALDVLLNPAMGEGFGIPILEAQACGVPVITGDWTAMSEINKTGWLIDKKDALRTWTPLAAYQWTPQPAAIKDALNQAYAARLTETFSERQRISAQVADYEADNVVEKYWKPVLAKLAAPTENRAARRRKIKMIDKPKKVEAVVAKRIVPASA